MIERREYQIQAVSKVSALLAAGRHTCLVSPTGSGKTAMALLTVAESSEHAWAIITHRDELRSQLQVAFPERPILSWQEQAIRRTSWPLVTRLFIDECHHAGARGPWGQCILEDFPNAIRFGATATPQRGDGSPLAGVFDELVVAANYSELLRAGYLVGCYVWRPNEELNGLAKRPVDEYLLRTPGEKAICFVGGKQEAEEVAEQFRHQGVSAAAITDSTPAARRAEIIQRFRDGTILVLVNIFVATEGFDVPDCSVCIIARGCEATGTYLQMVGRSLRPSPGKAWATLLDLRGVSHRHGLPTQDRAYALTGRAITTVAPLRLCPACGWCYEPANRCPSCGYVATAAERKQQILNEQTDLAVERKPADPAELERLLTLARARGYGEFWAVSTYRKTHEKLAPWPTNLYAQIYGALRKKGKNRVQSHAMTTSVLK